MTPIATATARGRKGRWGMGDTNWANLGISLDELLADPLIGLIMRADKVDPAQIRRCPKINESFGR